MSADSALADRRGRAGHAQGSDSIGGVSVENLKKEYVYRKKGSQVLAIRGVSFSVEQGDFFTLLGPSGCGKTTTMRCIAGLERPQQGRISLGGTVMSDESADIYVPPQRRDIGMVFQSYGIWPHLSVFENVAFPLRVGKDRISKRQLRDRVEEALAVVQLSDYVGRNATQLSGGQQQRLALARALVRQPALLLLDEPLSNLDAKLREAMRKEIVALQKRIGVTTIYVTHDQGEALSMSDQIAVMADGELLQLGSPNEIYHRPASRFVADFVGRTNFMPAEIVERRDGNASCVVLGATTITPRASGDLPAEGSALVSVRPEDVALSLPTGNDLAANELAGIVRDVEFMGDVVETLVTIADTELVSRQMALARWRPGDEVIVALNVANCTALRPD